MTSTIENPAQVTYEHITDDGRATPVNARKWLLRIESVAIAVAVLLLYARLGFAWWTLALLLLLPDVSMVGYLVNNRVGALAYNVFHTYVGPLVLAVVGWSAGWDLGVQLALIWSLHIAVDRLLGYGLKSDKGFKHTHLDDV